MPNVEIAWEVLDLVGMVGEIKYWFAASPVVGLSFREESRRKGYQRGLAGKLARWTWRGTEMARINSFNLGFIVVDGEQPAARLPR